jgi:hypothetical protein
VNVLQEKLVKFSRLKVSIILHVNNLLLQALVLRQELIEQILHFLELRFRHFPILS